MSSTGVHEQQSRRKKKTQRPLNAKAYKKIIVGLWERKGYIYSIRADGSVRAEKYINGQLVAWKTGTWLIQHTKISLNFTQFSDNHAQHDDPAEKFMSGVLKLGENNKSFTFRSQGALKYFKKKAHTQQIDSTPTSLANQ